MPLTEAGTSEKGYAGASALLASLGRPVAAAVPATMRRKSRRHTNPALPIPSVLRMSEILYGRTTNLLGSVRVLIIFLRTLLLQQSLRNAPSDFFKAGCRLSLQRRLPIGIVFSSHSRVRESQLEMAGRTIRRQLFISLERRDCVRKALRGNK